MRDESERWDESASEGSNHKPGGEADEGMGVEDCRRWRVELLRAAGGPVIDG